MFFSSKTKIMIAFKKKLNWSSNLILEAFSFPNLYLFPTLTHFCLKRKKKIQPLRAWKGTWPVVMSSKLSWWMAAAAGFFTTDAEVQDMLAHVRFGNHYFTKGLGSENSKKQTFWQHHMKISFVLECFVMFLWCFALFPFSLFFVWGQNISLLPFV